MSKGPHVFPTVDKNVHDMSIDVDMDLIGIVDAKTIKIFSLSDKNFLYDLQGVHSDRILTLDLSKNAKYIASGGKDGTIVIWDLKEKKAVRSLKSQNIITALCFSPGNDHLAFGSENGQVSIYDIGKGEVIRRFSDHQNDITSIVYSKDGRFLVTGGAEGGIMVYEKNILQVSLVAHKKWVREIKFYPDHKKMVSCGDDGKVMIWDTTDMGSPRLISNVNYGKSWILAIDAYRDNSTYAIGNLKGEVRIIGTFGDYRTKIGSPINKIYFVPQNGDRLKVVVASRGKGVMLLDAKKMKLRNR